MGNSSTALNFGAGPAKLPREVLEQVQSEMLSYQGTNMSIVEMSHRGREFTQINNSAQNLVRELLNVPSNYKILLMQGGGSGAFAAVALNLLNRTGTADYAVTGAWSAKAAKEAAKYGDVKLVFPAAAKHETIPAESAWTRNPNASYFYYCDNETIDGVQFASIPSQFKNVPIVSDMSSSIMTKAFDVSKLGIVIAGAQKNIGPAGVTLVIIREDLLGNPMKICPSILDFTLAARENSVYNTPATFSVYVLEKVLQWILKQKGVEAMEKVSVAKSKLLYDAIASSRGFYSCPVDVKCRSRVNVPFRVGRSGGSADDEAKFVEEAENLKMFQLKGHRSVGGIRASLYNAVSLGDVELLIKFMDEFKKKFDK